MELYQQNLALFVGVVAVIAIPQAILRFVLGAGSGGGLYGLLGFILTGALIQVVAGILDEGLEPQEAVSRPRLHPARGLVHLEPGFDDDVHEALEEAGFQIRAWPAPHHYFGGVSVVTRYGAAGDPRRSGAAAVPSSH